MRDEARLRATSVPSLHNWMCSSAWARQWFNWLALWAGSVMFFWSVLSDFCDNFYTTHYSYLVDLHHQWEKSGCVGGIGYAHHCLTARRIFQNHAPAVDWWRHWTSLKRGWSENLVIIKRDWSTRSVSHAPRVSDVDVFCLLQAGTRDGDTSATAHAAGTWRNRIDKGFSSFTTLRFHY